MATTGGPTATTRSSSAAATTASSPRPTSARPGCGRSSLERRETRRRRGRHVRARARASGSRPWPTRSGGCGRRSSATSTCKRHGLSLVGPDVRVFAPGPDGRAITLWGDPARTAEGLRARSAARRRGATPAFDRLVRSLARLPRRARRPDAARHRIARASATRWPGSGSGGRSAASGSDDGRTITRVLPMAIADFVAESFETDALRAAHRLARRPVHRDGAVVGRHDRRPARRLGRQRRRRGRPDGLRPRRPGRAGGGARGGGPGGRRRDPDRRRGRRDHLARRPGDRRRPGRRRGDRGAGRRRRHRPEADADRRSSTRSPSGPSLLWRAGNIRTPGTVAKVNLALAGLPRFTGRRRATPRLLRGRIVVAPGIDAMERAHDAAKYGRLSDDARSWRRRSRRWSTRRWSTARRAGHARS